MASYVLNIHTCCLLLVPYLCGVDPDYDDVHTADGPPVRVQGAEGYIYIYIYIYRKFCIIGHDLY